MSDPTPIARGSVSPISQNMVEALAEFALSVADYESLWRAAAQSDHDFGGLGEIVSRQDEARGRLCEEKFIDGSSLPPAFVRAIEAALILATGRVTGQRSQTHRGQDAAFASVDNAAKFIRDAATGEK